MYEFGSVSAGRQDPSGHWIDVRNPYDGALVGRVAAAERASVLAAVERVRNRRLDLPRHERAAILERMAAALGRDRDEVSRRITAESGLSLRDASHEVERARDVLRFAAMQALADDSSVFPCDVSPNGNRRRIYTTRQPLRLVAAITPFNHPLNQVVHKVAPAIASNNKIVLKPSLDAPLSAHYLAVLALECGLPPDAFNVFAGPTAEVAEPLVKSELVDMITFTGSTAVGRRIAALAGYKRVVLELGGNSACLVLEDANVEEAVAIALRGVFPNSGQRCTAIRRLLVHEQLATEFATRLAEKASALRHGDPSDPATEVGTLIHEDAAKLVESRVEETLRAGARLLTGHRRRGACYAPTVLDGVENHHPVVASETFGPVASIIRFSTLDEAIALANRTPYGLSGAVVSQHWPSIQRVVTELDTGAVNVNEAPSFRLESSPFGGVKSSGLGYKEGVVEAIRGMTWLKTYSLPWDVP